MHLFNQNAEADPAAAGAIPVIDYGPYFAGRPGTLAPLAAALAHACGHVRR